VKAKPNLRKRFVIAAIVLPLVGWALQAVAIREIVSYWNLAEVEKLKPGPPMIPVGDRLWTK
jgi:hypothetical protein